MTARLPTKNKKSKRKTGVAPGLRRHGLGLRARRRAALAAMKAKARKIYPHDKTGRLANHMAVCSCLCCGNARKSEGRTLAERRALDSMRAELVSFGSDADPISDARE